MGGTPHDTAIIRDISIAKVRTLAAIKKAEYSNEEIESHRTQDIAKNPPRPVELTTMSRNSDTSSHSADSMIPTRKGSYPSAMNESQKADLETPDGRVVLRSARRKSRSVERQSSENFVFWNARNKAERH